MSLPRVRGGPGQNRGHMKRSASFKRVSRGKTLLDSGTEAPDLLSGPLPSASAGNANNNNNNAQDEEMNRSAPSGFGRQTSTRSFARNFLEEDDSNNMNAMANTSNSNNSGGAEEAPPIEFDVETQQRIHRSLLNPPSSPDSAQKNKNDDKDKDKNLFASRDDYYNVDQSVNLMDAGAGTYESKSNRQKKGMVEVFLQEATGGGGVGGYSNGSINGKKKQRNSNGNANFFWSPQGQQQAAAANKKKKMMLGLTIYQQLNQCCGKYLIPFACVLLVGVVLGIVVVFTTSSTGGSTATTAAAAAAAVDITSSPPKETPAPTASPPGATNTEEPPSSSSSSSSEVMTPEMKAMKTILMELDVTHIAIFDETETPEYKALQWVSQDSIAVNAIPNNQVRRRLAEDTTGIRQQDTERFVQRYVLAVFYHSMDNPTQANALQNWLTQDSECDWQGVDCHDETAEDMANPAMQHLMLTKIRALNLTKQDLHGHLPRELDCLPHLVELDLRHNRLTGSTLDRFAFHRHWRDSLEYLLLGNNSLLGRVPENMAALQAAVDIDLSHNDLSGPLPTMQDFVVDEKWTNLKNLFLNDNQLTGSIPSTFLQEIPRLQFLDVSNNQLTGELPVELYQLSHLTHLLASNNSFTGSLPEDLGALTRLGMF